MTYIEVFKGENPDTVFMERLQHIREMHGQRKISSTSIDSFPSECDMAKIEEEDTEKTVDQFPSNRRLSRQKQIEYDSIEEAVHEQEDDKENQTNLDTHASNNNFSSFAIGERVLVQQEDRYLFGHVRFIGRVLFADTEQIGIELDQPYGKRLAMLIGNNRPD